MPVPNQPPEHTAGYRIAIIGDSPGQYDEADGQPFCGPAGKLLNGLLSRAGIDRYACFLGNVSQHRPTANEFSTLPWDGDAIQGGITKLKQEMEDYRPHLIVCLGNASLHLAKEGNVAPRRIKNKYRWPNAIGDWRGSLLWSSFFNCKVMGSYSPSNCLANYENTPILHLDLKRAAEEGTRPLLDLPQRTLEVSLSSQEIISRLATIRREGCLLSVDIEGYVDSLWCIGFATAPDSAFVVPFAGADGGNYWPTAEEEMAVWKAVVEVLQDPDVPKVLQNSLYDRFVLHYSYNICVRGVLHDTMLAAWEHYCELPKGLGFQASIYTKEPYWKQEAKYDSFQTRLEYCAKDAAVTYEICQVLDRYLDDRAKKHYRFNVEMLNPILAMELQGIRYDAALAKSRREAIQEKVFEYQHELDTVAGKGLKAVDYLSLFDMAKTLMGDKNKLKRAAKNGILVDWDFLKTNCTKDYKDSVKRMAKLVQQKHLTTANRGELHTLLECHLNVGSNKQLCDYLYNELKLPLQIDRKTKAATADYEAVLKIGKKTSHPACGLILEIRTLGTRARMLEISADGDGRIRCGYNIVGTETGRLTCYTSPTGSGYNLQTLPSENLLKPDGHPLRTGMRDLLLADSDFWFFQCDLSGADLWTVAAHCAALGDRTMLEDLQFGIKPIKVLTLGLRGQTQYLDQRCPREEIKEASTAVKSSDWDYFGCKIGAHGTDYGMKEQRMSDQIFVESEGKLLMTTRETRDLQHLWTMRYRGIISWHNRCRGIIERSPVLIAASGQRRYFFGRWNEILNEYLASEPQMNTTYATNLATHRLWSDPDNRTDSSGRLKIYPLHSVHDAVCGEFHKDDTSWAVSKIRDYFNNTLVIAGQPIVIPFEGSYGPAWGQLGEKHGGGVI